MKYMLLIYANEKDLTESYRQNCYVESAQLARDLHSNGKYVHASPLQPIATATSVRIREGKRIVTDGPFAETREQLGGFYLIDAADLDEAITIASRVPVARPRSAAEARAPPAGHNTTVHPVTPAGSVQWPTVMPSTSVIAPGRAVMAREDTAVYVCGPCREATRLNPTPRSSSSMTRTAFVRHSIDSSPASATQSGRRRADPKHSRC